MIKYCECCKIKLKFYLGNQLYCPKCSLFHSKKSHKLGRLKNQIKGLRLQVDKYKTLKQMEKL